MGAITIAFGASVLTGVAGGMLGATRGRANRVRPRGFIRRHRPVFETVAVSATVIGLMVAAAAVAASDALRTSLAVSCAAAAVLFAAAAWLVLVEPDDDGDSDPAVDPSWWPQFERELAAWRRTRRAPTSSRR